MSVSLVVAARHQAVARRSLWPVIVRTIVGYAVFIVQAYAATAAPVRVAIQVQDDSGETVTVTEPARRIVSLAPHVTELLFAAGAGPFLVGVAEYSDFPKAAKVIPRIGDARGLDLERITALRPDLIVAWRSGNPAWLLEKLGNFGIPIFMSEPRRIEDVATNVERLGQLAGSFEVARQASASFREHHKYLRSRYSKRAPVKVFYQVWDRPLMTVNGAHLISDVMRLCGGVNVFAGLPTLTARIDAEAVLSANPAAIVAAGTKDSNVLDAWRRWSYLDAVKKGNLFIIPHNLIARHTPRILEGAERLCAALEQVRKSQ